ncbi:DMT family transporter [Nisaea sp.]|uniref:DMT family transporter n=1 Tax=Nisaea sp. TaxID=2024842 RepID=UPI0032631761
MLISLSAPSPRLRGIGLVGISVLFFSTAGLFTKGVPEDAWTIVFWRGLTAAGVTFGYLLMTSGLRRELASFGWPALFVSLLGASGSAAFIAAFKLTSIANVALIYATVPFLAAILAWVCLRERPTRRTLLASCATIAGVVIIFGGSIGGTSPTGDLLALWMTFTLAGSMVVYRRWPETSAAIPSALSSIVLLPIALIVAAPLNAAPEFMPAMAAFGLVFAVSSIALMAGARLLPSAETALLSALETPVAPLLAFLFLAEVPPTATFIGGGMILFAVLWSQWPRK